MSTLGMGTGLSELKNRIDQLKFEIKQLGPVPNDAPEMIETANLLRQNEYFSKSDVSKSDLISNYELYVDHLELLLKSIFEIQNDLKNIVHEQNQLLSKEKSKRKSKIKSNK